MIIRWSSLHNSLLSSASPDRQVEAVAATEDRNQVLRPPLLSPFSSRLMGKIALFAVVANPCKSTLTIVADMFAHFLPNHRDPIT